MLIPVILSGGAGTRLWPVSREAHPKPFIRLADGKSLLQKTYERALALPSVDYLLTVTNREYYFQTRDELARIRGHQPQSGFLLEPEGRNTAPAILLAAIAMASKHPEAVLLVLPADHVITDQAAFADSVKQAVTLAESGWLATFGIQPNRPETGYGYIEQGNALATGYDIARFVEKPNLETAQAYLSSGRFFWNAGMFAFRVDVFLSEYAALHPEQFALANTVWEKTAATGLEPWLLDPDTFAQLDNISIDYAVMEKTAKAAVVPASFDWNDIGAWPAMASLTEADPAGNQVDGEALMIDSKDCYVRAEGRLIAAIGLEGLMIVDTADALLVAPKARAQEVKKVVDHLKSIQHEAFHFHRTVYRPWGTYTTLEEDAGYKIKRIVVKPGASLSLQMHYHRSEHWVVVSGTAKIVNGEAEILVQTNESAYIPAGTPHRLMNPGIIDCVMIEVQSGQYLGEDDIVRLEDNYGRCEVHK